LLLIGNQSIVSRRALSVHL